MCSWNQCLVPKLPTAVVLTATYRELHLGSSWVPIYLCNLSTHSIEIPTRTVVGQVVPANQVPLVVLLRGTSEESNSNAQKGWVLEALDLQGLREWPKPEQEQAQELVFKWEHIFACSDLNLGRTALIKHKIKVTDWMPSRNVTDVYLLTCTMMWRPISRRCWTLVPSESHTICGLVQWSWFGRRSSSLRSCFNLRKLNNWTIKDAYLLPYIDETLDSLQRSQWFSSLNLKLGYWWVKVDNESKPLTMFTMGLLGVYECKRMPFQTHQCPTSFQRLMETSLGDLNLHWCIIYLDDIANFSKDPVSHLERLGAVFCLGVSCSDDRLPTWGI